MQIHLGEYAAKPRQRASVFAEWLFIEMSTYFWVYYKRKR